MVLGLADLLLWGPDPIGPGCLVSDVRIRVWFAQSPDSITTVISSILLKKTQLLSFFKKPYIMAVEPTAVLLIILFLNRLAILKLILINRQSASPYKRVVRLSNPYSINNLLITSIDNKYFYYISYLKRLLDLRDYIPNKLKFRTTRSDNLIIGFRARKDIITSSLNIYV